MQLVEYSTVDRNLFKCYDESKGTGVFKMK